MAEPIHPARVYLKTWAALLVLLVLTTAAGYLHLGRFNLVLALSIAITKALLIVLFFMHIHWSSRILKLAAFAGVLWLGIMLTFILTDYFTRRWDRPQYGTPPGPEGQDAMFDRALRGRQAAPHP